MNYTPILATLGYVLSKDGNCVLMIHRNTRPGDLHIGKYNGLGGKMEACEDVATCMTREIQEEAGIEVTAMTLRGTISWPGFGKNGEDWFGFIFLVTDFEGEPHSENPEGTLEWIPLEKLLAGELPLWEGDKHFLPMVFDENPAVFHGVMPYLNGKMSSWKWKRL
jgi:8-oxo-dGTP diphosphatase